MMDKSSLNAFWVQMGSQGKWQLLHRWCLLWLSAHSWLPCTPRFFSDEQTDSRMMDSWVPSLVCPSEATKQKLPVWLSFLLIGFWNREIISSLIHVLSLSQEDNIKIEQLPQNPQFGNDNVSKKQIELKENGQGSFAKHIANSLLLCMEGKKLLCG